jgi:hypothetical protein
VSQRSSRASWIINVGLVVSLGIILCYEQGVSRALSSLATLGFVCALIGLVARLILAIAWHQKIVQLFEIVAISYCIAYSIWWYVIGDVKVLLVLTFLGAGSGVIIGIGLLFGESPWGRRLEEAEDRAFKAIAKKFKRNEA